MIYLALAAFAIFFVISYKNTVLGLAGLAALLPSYLLRFKIFGLPGTLLETMIWAVLLGCLARSLAYKKESRGDWQRLFSRLKIIKWPLGLFFLASIIAVFISPDKIAALGLWRAYFLEAGLVFFTTLSVVKDRRDFEKIVFGLGFAALYISIFALGQKFFNLPIPPPWQAELRATSIFEYPNAVGLFLAPIVILLLGFCVAHFREKRLSAYGLLFVALLSVAAIITAQSDGGIVAILGGAFIFLLLYALEDKKSRAAGIIFLLLVAIAAGLVFGTVAPVKEKLTFNDWSGFVRLTIWGETWSMLKDNFIFGGGLGGYSIKILPYHESRDWMEVFLYPHNIIFNFWSELGILGLAAFIWLLEKFGRMCYHLIKWDKLFAVTTISAMAALVIHGLVDVPYFKNDLSILFWIIYVMPLIAI